MSNDALSQLSRYCKQADTTAFNSFYRNQSGKLWQFLVNRGCSQDSAYDLLAETFIKFLQVVCRDLRSPLALLYRIAINLHIDQYRREKKSPVSYDGELADSQAEPPTEYSDEKDLVAHLLKKLPESEQNLMFMRYWVGLTHKEIAQIMEIPEGSIRRQNAAIIRKMQQHWQAEQDDS